MELVTFSVVIGALLAVSELLSLIPSVKSNGVFQMVWNMLKACAGKEEA